jgi:hypothetical protein
VSRALTKCAKVSFIFTDTFAELCGFGFHTGVRDVADVADFLAAVDPIWDQFGNVMALSHRQRLLYSEWDIGPGFTGWHQHGSLDTAVDAGGGDSLPPQLAIVIGVKNTTETGIPLGRRRNRSYIGPCKQSDLAAGAGVTASASTALTAAVVNLDTAMRTVPAAEDSPAYDGLCIASPTGNVMLAGEELTLGHAFDTMRSRRQKVPENPTVTLIP